MVSCLTHGNPGQHRRMSLILFYSGGVKLNATLFFPANPAFEHVIFRLHLPSVLIEREREKKKKKRANGERKPCKQKLRSPSQLCQPQDRVYACLLLCSWFAVIKPSIPRHDCTPGSRIGRVKSHHSGLVNVS